MKVLLVANGYPPYAVGGVEVYTAGIAEALQLRGHAVSVLCAEGKPDESDYNVLEERSGQVALYRLINNYRKIHSFADTFADPRVDSIFQALLERVQPDLIHFNHLIALSARLPLLARERHIPSLFTAHDFWALCQRIYLHDSRKQACPGPVRGGNCYTCITAASPAQRARTAAVSTARKVVPFRARVVLRRLLTRDDYFLPDLQATPEVLAARYEAFRDCLQATNRIVTPSQFVKQMFVANGYEPSRIEVLPLGMTAPVASPAPRTQGAGPLRFAFVGAILPWKGVEVLARGFMAAKNPDIRLTYYGREDIIPAFSRALRRRAASDGRIAFAGPFQPADKDRAYRDIDVLIIPSMAHESFSLVAREALLRRIPVVASDIGALPEVVRDGANGFLVQPGRPEPLTEIITRIAEQPELLRSLVLPGPVPIFTVDQHIERLLGIYDACRALPS